MVTKTRDRLIEVARQLFAHQGIENTTMNDIATASDKGRRTIYTYFRNKRDIYNAVVERESDQLMGRLAEVTMAQMAPADKLRTFLEERFGLFLSAFTRRDSFRALFGRDFKRLEKLHRLVFAKELALLQRVLDEGVEAGVFDPARAALLPGLEAMAFQGIDYSHFRDNFKDTGLGMERVKRDVVDYIMGGILLPASPPEPAG